MTDQTGAVVERTACRPYGEEVALAQPLTLPETKGFIGERFDDASGLQYLNARYYDPRLGMFVQPDWWEVTEPGVGTNRYAYSFNDPVNGKDPTGHVVGVDDATVIVGGAIAIGALWTVENVTDYLNDGELDGDGPMAHATRSLLDGIFSATTEGGVGSKSTLSNFGNSFGIDDFLTETSSSGQFLGSIALKSAVVHGDLVTFTFENSSTIDSFLYSSGRLERFNVPRTLTSSPPMSTTTQTIRVTTPIDGNWPLDPSFCERTGACQ